MINNNGRPRIERISQHRRCHRSAENVSAKSSKIIHVSVRKSKDNLTNNGKYLNQTQNLLQVI